MSAPTPNLRKLIHFKMVHILAAVSQSQIDAQEKIKDEKLFQTFYRQAGLWAVGAINAVKSAPDNPYGDDNEKIAAAILAKIDTRLVTESPVIIPGPESNGEKK